MAMTNPEPDILSTAPQNATPRVSMTSETQGSGRQLTLMALPPEVQLEIITLLNPIDATCFGLTNLYQRVHPTPVTLTAGSPKSLTPVIKSSGCKWCVPCLWYPAHCELRNHLSKWMPQGLEYCMSCEIFTYATTCEERTPWRRICGTCGEVYGSQKSICRERLEEAEPGERRWPKFYGERPA